MADTRYGYGRIAKCGLCFNLLETPKTLLCSHSFCLHCLLRYIRYICQQNINATSFPCPRCNVIIKVSGRSVSEWAESLPTNKVLEVVVSALKKNDVEKMCHTCNRFRRKVPACIWCRDCAQFICSKCKNQHDLHFPDHDIEKVGDDADDTQLFVSKLEDICQHHKKELQFYCNDHETVVCADCVATSSHNDCGFVEISDKMESFISPYSQLGDARETLIEIGDEISYNLQMAFDKKARKQQIKSDLLKLRSEIDKRLDAIQNNMESTLDKEFTNYLEANSSLTSELEFLQGELSDTYHMIKAIMRYGPNSEKLLCLQELSDHNKFLKYREKFHNLWQQLPTLDAAISRSISKSQITQCENLFGETQITKLQNFQKVKYTEILCCRCIQTDCHDGTLATFVIKLDHQTATCCYSTRVKDISELRINLVHNKHFSPEISIHSIPLSVLLDGQKTLVAFGSEAEEMYSRKLEAGGLDDWYYFHRVNFFADNKILKNEGNITDVCGRKVSSLLVLSAAIGRLKDDFITKFEEKMGFDPTTDRNTSISWVVVVPSTIQEPDKQFVSEAAVKVGFLPGEIAVTTESEAAFLACRCGAVDEFDVTENKGNVLVLNSKARSLDISVIGYDSKTNYTVLSESHLGSYCGGDMVKEAFKQLLIKIIGAPIFNDFETTCKPDYYNLMQEIEAKKRGLQNHMSNWVTIRIPISLIEIFEEETGEEFRETVLQTEYAGRLQIVKDKLKFDKDVFYRLFSLLFENITAEAQCHLDENKHSVTTVIACGDFALCPLLQQHLKSYFSLMKVIYPSDLSLDNNILKGATVSGFRHLNPIRSNKVVGVKTVKAFERSDPIEKKIMTEATSFCQDAFTIIAQDGYTMRTTFVPLDEMQKKMEFFVYVATKHEVDFVDDSSVSYIGSIVVDIPVYTEVNVKTTFLNRGVTITATNEQNGFSKKRSFDL